MAKAVTVAQVTEGTEAGKETSDVISMESPLVCGVCLEDFDAEYRRPLLLPACGHTFCRTCVKDLGTRGDMLVCPACRSKYSQVDTDSFPVNFNIQVLASSRKNIPKEKVTGSDCSVHGIRFAFWCRTCEAPACGECLFDGHPRPAHTLCRIQVVVNEIKSRAQELAKEGSEEAVTKLGDALRAVFRSISNLQEASHLLQETARVTRATQSCRDLPAITSVFERAKGVRQRVADLLHDATDEENTPRNHSRLCSELRTRPVVVALCDTGGLAHVKVEEKGIHVYSLRPSSTAYSVALKLNVLLSCLKKESPKVFLDLRAGERPLGRVYITLWGAMRRAQQFMALCLGTLGPSYRGSKFDGVNDRGQAGEYIRGGDYQGKSGLGGEALMDNLEWSGTWTMPKVAGQVCGVGGEEERKFGALYAICLRNNPSDTFRCPFGMVSSGLEVLEVASRHVPLSKVEVADCGVVIALP